MTTEVYKQQLNPSNDHPHSQQIFRIYIDRRTYYMPPVMQCSRMQELERRVAPVEHAAGVIAQVNTNRIASEERNNLMWKSCSMYQ